MLEGELLDLATSIAAVDQTEQPTNLLKGETKVAASPNEDQTPEVLLAVKPVPSLASWWCRQQSGAFVKPHRFDIAPARFGQLPSPQRCLSTL